MIDITTLTIATAHTHLINKDFFARDLAEAYLAEIKKTNGDINAYLEIYDDVLAQADNADKIIASGTATLLTGIPIALKDNLLITGKHVTSASKILEGYVAPYDATVVDKLKKEHVVFLGRTNMDEFAMGGSTENSAFGVTKNPLDMTRVAGGSSGGSAAVVAMNGALGALGSDTGGSVREPATFCGVVGLKPTYGGVSRHGLMAMGSSLDVIGPITKTVTDAEILFNAIKGQDMFDSTTYPDGQYPQNTNKKLVIGVPYHILEQEGIDQSVRDNFTESIKKLEQLGYEIQDISLPNIGYSLAVYYILMPAEVSSNLARFDGIKYGLHVDGDNLLQDYLKTRAQGFGPEVRRRILIGTYVLSAGYHDAYYNKAILLRQKISDEFAHAFQKVDAIVTPTTPTPSFKIGEKAHDPLSMYLADIFTVPANIVGIPAISIPSGMVTYEGSTLPVGLQIMAPHAHESVLFEISKKFLGE
ncbi:MAG: aspartyl-tRNA(Asn)/glutamyl-tRNA(Gln) amidotransferase subunit [Patescibacteria group bacterium]|nr:aspartyl-tRNA(Asn)/glutamyl-tRNA(Gln) amidotransferase subunit [Patescibacteria group bacterium]